VGASLQIEKDRDISFGEPVAELFQYGCFPHPPLPVDDEDMIGIFAHQAVLDPIEYILPAEEHPCFGDGRACDVRIDQFGIHDPRIHDKPGWRMPSMLIIRFPLQITSDKDHLRRVGFIAIPQAGCLVQAQNLEICHK